MKQYQKAMIGPTRLHCPAAFQKRITDPICCYFIVYGQKKLPLDFFEWFEKTFDQDFMITCPGTDFDHPRGGVIRLAEIYKLPSANQFTCLFFGFEISAELGKEIYQVATEGDVPLIEHNSDKWGNCGCIYTFLQSCRPDLFEQLENEILLYFRKNLQSQTQLHEIK